MIQLTVNKLHFYRFKLEAYVCEEFETSFEELQKPDRQLSNLDNSI